MKYKFTTTNSTNFDPMTVNIDPKRPVKRIMRTKEIQTARAICEAEYDSRVFVHSADGSIEYVLDGSELLYLQDWMMKKLTKSIKTRRDK